MKEEGTDSIVSGLVVQNGLVEEPIHFLLVELQLSWVLLISRGRWSATINGMRVIFWEELLRCVG